MLNDAFSFPSLQDLGNESDVEQKVIYPFVTAAPPFGLGYPRSSVLTKKNIRGCEIGKGTTKKSYFPDYILTAGTLPRVVIEAKGPNEDLDEAFREARLYATEINALFPKGLNPLTHVVACNGVSILYGYWDQAAPCISVELKDVGVANTEVAALIEQTKFEILSKESDRIRAASKPRLYKPRRMLGGTGVQNEEIGLNSFGARIQGELLHIFNPATMEDREQIVRHAYVGSKRRERYVDPIDRVIRAATPPSHSDSTLLEDTANPEEITRRLSELKPLENKILLLIGTVGAGKTTFLDYLQVVALPKEVLEKTVWVRTNMNAAPMSAEEIYTWLRQEIIRQCRASLPNLDFDDLNELTNLYSVELNQFKKGPGKLFQKDEITFSIKLGERLQSLQGDLQVTARAHTRFCASERGKLLVIAMDNCDKRTLPEQLLMFQAAQWLQKEFRCLIILPLREETYDNYRDRPPLDTALKDLVFRIEPPLFQSVLHKRIQLALSQLDSHDSRKLSFDLPNGFRVEYGANEISFYLTSIVRSIFEHDKFIRRLITGLAGRNMRRALEIFIEFCTSGHIGEDQILRIKHAEGAYSIPLDIVTRVLLRSNRKFYDSDYSYIKNVYGANWLDEDPNHFIRRIVLSWLFANISETGPSGLKGYFSLEQIKAVAVPFGITESSIEREVMYLLKGHCLVSESYKTEGLSDSDLIRLAPAGMVHLDLLSNVDYLAAVAEDTYFDSEETAQAIASPLRRDRSFRRDDVITSASALLDYLSQERDRRLSFISAVTSDKSFEALTDLSESSEAIKRSRTAIFGTQWDDATARYPVGTKHNGTIVNPHLEHGLFVELEAGITGLIPKSTLNLAEISLLDYSNLGELGVEVEVVKIDATRARMALRFCRFLDD